jgi:hypothetical protein
MKQSSTLVLRVAIIAMGLAVLALCVFALPSGIANEDFGAYRYILAGLYAPAIPFFAALWQAMKLLHLIDKNKAFSEMSLSALRTIHRYALIITAFFAIGMPYVYSVANRDDAPGVVVIGLVFMGAAFVVAVFSALLQKLFQNAMDIQSENELTV